MRERARVRWRRPARRGLIRSRPSSTETGQVLDRDNAGARRVAVEAVVEFIGIAPAFDQRHGRAGRQWQIAHHAPFALETPVDRWITIQVDCGHAPPLLLGQYLPGL